jgi:hypothetical protein
MTRILSEISMSQSPINNALGIFCISKIIVIKSFPIPPNDEIHRRFAHLHKTFYVFPNLNETS